MMVRLVSCQRMQRGSNGWIRERQRERQVDALVTEYVHSAVLPPSIAHPGPVPVL
jgi:hypothetical protein